MDEENTHKRPDGSTREFISSKALDRSSGLVLNTVTDLESGASEESQPTNHHKHDSDEVQHIHHVSPLSIIVERYEGDKCEGLVHGEGVAYFQGGHKYKGHFSHGFMDGHGEYIWSDGVKYQGDFRSNAPMGRGTYTWLDGSTYEGEVHRGLRHGVGTYRCAKTSTVYRGQWNLSKRHGRGIIYYNLAATSWYEGDWINNCREGWGVRCYPSGNVYEGEWKNNVCHGEGTMKWVQLSEQYSGQWVNGIQEGKGTHTWFIRRAFGSRYPLRNEYTGEFVQGLRHGKGKFSYASGAVYSGEWKHDKKHGQAKFTFKNGRIFEGEFVEDRMAELPAQPDEGDSARRAIQSNTNPSLLGSDMILSIQALLNRVPESHRDQELKQVEFAVLRHIGLLRDLYSFYGRLGQESPDNTFPLTQLQFLRFLKDCKIHQHGITLAQMKSLINEDIQPDELHSPSSIMLPRECFSYVIIAAYHMYYKDIECSNNVIAACFSKFMKQNIIPNAKNVKGPLFHHPAHAVVACKYTDRCWDVYQTMCKAYSVHSKQTLTVRQFIWMLKDLSLYDGDLTISKVLEILSVENPKIHNVNHSNLELEMTFLEFFEALVGCAEVKGKRTQAPVESQSDIYHHGAVQSLPRCETREDLITEPSSQAVTSYQMVQSSLHEKIEQTQVPVFAFKEPVKGTGVEERLEDWIQKTHQFFVHTFFPAFEQSVNMKNKVQDEKANKTQQNHFCRGQEQCKT